MSAPVTASAEFPDVAFHFALLPLPDGDFALVAHDVKHSGEYLVVIPQVVGLVPVEQRDNLIHLAPVKLDAPDDLVEQFRKQLGIEGDK